MCQSKADGGRRCPETATTKTLRAMRKKAKRATARGDLTKAQEVEERINHLTQAREKYGPIVSDLELPVPHKIANLMDALSKDGATPLIVGGSVRDALNGDTAPKDFDIEVHGQSMDDIARTLRKNGYAADMVGRQFGVIKTRVGGEEIDISVPRKDSLTGTGHRGFTVETDENMGVREAASRRDFTINAMMYDHTHKVAIDPYGGREDLENGVLRHVSDAFSEDPLRPLRGFQFAARYGLTMDPETAEVCKSLRPRVEEISKERIQTEWMKFYSKSTTPSAGLAVLRQMGWDDTVPGLSKINEAHLDNAIAIRKNSNEEDRGVLVAAVAMSSMDKEEARKFSRLTMVGDKPRNKALELAATTAPQSLTRSQVRKWSRSLEKKKLTVQDWVDKQNAIEADPKQTAAVVEETKKHQVFERGPVESLAGKDVLELFPDKKPGPWVGALINKARDAEDEGVFTDNAGARKWALENG